MTYLYSKLVEKVVDEVFGTADEAVIKVLTSNFMENSSERRRTELVVETEILLVPVDCYFECQDGQHQ